MATENTHSNIDNFGFGGPRSEADIDDTKVNRATYTRASLAARQFARRKGVSPIKATKALSEAVRAEADFMYGTGRQGQAHLTRGLTGLTSRLSTGDRSGRVSKDGNYRTIKGSMIDTFGRYFANETVGGRTPVLRPKLPSGTVKGTVKGAKTAANILKFLP
jgi:hypothetical protein